MSHLLPRFHRRRLEQDRYRNDRLGPLLDDSQVDQAVRESVPEVYDKSSAGSTRPGDARRLRGIPVCAMGVSGTSPGTDPLAQVLRR